MRSRRTSRGSTRMGAGRGNVVVVGAGLAGLVATADWPGGRKVILVDQEGRRRRSAGRRSGRSAGLFLVDSPEQRRMRIKDSTELALQDWAGTPASDRPEGLRPRRWAEAYVHFAAGEKRAWLTSAVTACSRGGLGRARRLPATGPGNSCRASTSPGVPARCRGALRAAGTGGGRARPASSCGSGHRVTGLTTPGRVRRP